MNNAGANELIMPALLLEETYEKTGRIEAFGNSIGIFIRPDSP